MGQGYIANNTVKMDNGNSLVVLGNNGTVVDNNLNQPMSIGGNNNTIENNTICINNVDKPTYAITVNTRYSSNTIRYNFLSAREL